MSFARIKFIIKSIPVIFLHWHLSLLNQLFQSVKYIRIEIHTHNIHMHKWERGSRKPFGKTTRAEFLLQLVHFDTCELMNVRTMYEATYFIHEMVLFI